MTATVYCVCVLHQVNREFFDQSWAGDGVLDPCASRLTEHVTFGHNAVVLTKVSEQRAHHDRAYGGRGFVEGYVLPNSDLQHSGLDGGVCLSSKK